MQALFSGFISGYLLSILWALLGAVALGRSQRFFLVLSRNLPTHLSTAVLMVPLLLFLSLLLTAVGLVMGFVYLIFQRAVPGAGLGSPNLAFTLMVAVIPALILLGLASGARRHLPDWPLLGLALTFALVFGWLLPFLAEA